MSLFDYSYGKSEDELAKLLEKEYNNGEEEQVESDELYARMLHRQLNGHEEAGYAYEEHLQEEKASELSDPNPDIHNLFVSFDKRFFSGRLACCELRWSKRMTRCAGLCCYEGRRGLCSIRLSEPLLKFRSRNELLETLLHEMIHAYLFVTQNNKDRDGHGPEFHKHMYRINSATGLNITVYHSFHDEVGYYQRHWWRCDGVCRQRSPYFGWCRRSMNRAPGPSDRWWSQHLATCGGRFIKVKGPADFADHRKTIKSGGISPKENGSVRSGKRKFPETSLNDKNGGDNVKKGRDIRSYFTKSNDGLVAGKQMATEVLASENLAEQPFSCRFPGIGLRLGTAEQL